MSLDTINVPEIHCDHCKASIEGALAPLSGVHEATVDVPGRRVTVSYDESLVTRDQLVAAIEDQGYAVPA